MAYELDSDDVPLLNVCAPCKKCGSGPCLMVCSACKKDFFCDAKCQRAFHDSEEYASTACYAITNKRFYSSYASRDFFSIETRVPWNPSALFHRSAPVLIERLSFPEEDGGERVVNVNFLVVEDSSLFADTSSATPRYFYSLPPDFGNEEKYDVYVSVRPGGRASEDFKENLSVYARWVLSDMTDPSSPASRVLRKGAGNVEGGTFFKRSVREIPSSMWVNLLDNLLRDPSWTSSKLWRAYSCEDIAIIKSEMDEKGMPHQAALSARAWSEIGNPVKEGEIARLHHLKRTGDTEEDGKTESVECVDIFTYDQTTGYEAEKAKRKARNSEAWHADDIRRPRKTEKNKRSKVLNYQKLLKALNIEYVPWEKAQTDEKMHSPWSKIGGGQCPFDIQGYCYRDHRRLTVNPLFTFKKFSGNSFEGILFHEIGHVLIDQSGRRGPEIELEAECVALVCIVALNSYVSPNVLQWVRKSIKYVKEQYVWENEPSKRPITISDKKAKRILQAVQNVLDVVFDPSYEVLEIGEISDTEPEGDPEVYWNMYPDPADDGRGERDSSDDYVSGDADDEKTNEKKKKKKKPKKDIAPFQSETEKKKKNEENVKRRKRIRVPRASERYDEYFDHYYADDEKTEEDRNLENPSKISRIKNKHLL